MITRRQFIEAASIPASMAVSQATFAQPQQLLKNANIVVGFAPGGSTDVVARFLAEKLRGKYAETVIVDNRPGAAARLAQDYVKTAPADGSIMVITPASTLTLYQYVFRKLNYQPDDFIAVSPVCTSPMAISVGPAVPLNITTLAGYLAWAKADPKNAIIGNGAPGGPPEFVATMLGRSVGINFNVVGYKGGAPLIADLLGGHVPAAVNVLTEPLPHIRAGKLRALAVAGRQRSPYLKEVPTLKEAGLSDPTPQGSFGVFVPSRTPEPVVARLNGAIRQALNAPETQQVLEPYAMEKFWLPSADFTKLLEAETTAWQNIVKVTGYVPQG